MLWDRTLIFLCFACSNLQAIPEHRFPTDSSKQTASFANWRLILTNPDIPLSAKFLGFTTSEVSSLIWLAGNLNISTAEFSKLSSWGARKLFVISGSLRKPTDSVGEHWQRKHCVGHALAAHFFVDLSASVFTSLACPKVLFQSTCWGWEAQKSTRLHKVNDKWHGVHPSRLNCSRWDTTYSTGFKPASRPTDSDTIECDWNCVPQKRKTWKASRDAFIEYALGKLSQHGHALLFFCRVCSIHAH